MNSLLHLQCTDSDALEVFCCALQDEVHSDILQFSKMIYVKLGQCFRDTNGRVEARDREISRGRPAPKAVEETLQTPWYSQPSLREIQT